MPVYTFECVNCHTRFDAHVAIERMQPNFVMPCEVCNQYGRRVFLPGRTQINAGFKPYVTEHIDGEPHLVASKREEDALCRENGVRRATESDMPAKKARTIRLTPLETDFERTRMDLKYQRVDRKNLANHPLIPAGS